MGRKTYESFAGVWEGRSGDPYTDQMNAMEKYVVSTSLRNPTWNNTTVVAGDVADHVERLKAQPGKGIVQYGFGVSRTPCSTTDYSTRFACGCTRSSSVRATPKG